MTATLAAIWKVGAAPILEAIEALTSDQATRETVRCIANPDRPGESVPDLTGNARLPDGPATAVDRKLVVGAVLLLVAGITVPLIAGATAEIILTNEIAIAALVVTTSALRKS